MGIRDVALLASRAVLGGYLAAHGAQKLFGSFGGHGIEPTAAAFDRLGLLKARILARDPRAVLHVSGDNFWAYAVAEGQATLTPAAAHPGDEACRELLEVHAAFYGPRTRPGSSPR
jgi:uncharacterized membrane protein YphA (DoxX/SURF4 family)